LPIEIERKDAAADERGKRPGERGVHLDTRHCEERSDAAAFSFCFLWPQAGLPRFARNDICFAQTFVHLTPFSPTFYSGAFS
jgi:hypothetical protein